jgi:hypothetical protein
MFTQRSVMPFFHNGTRVFLRLNSNSFKVVNGRNFPLTVYVVLFHPKVVHQKSTWPLIRKTLNKMNLSSLHSSHQKSTRPLIRKTLSKVNWFLLVHLLKLRMIKTLKKLYQLYHNLNGMCVNSTCSLYIFNPLFNAKNDYFRTKGMNLMQ